MSKECRECDHFNGWNDDDGTPYCEVDGGYEKCPYNDLAPTFRKNKSVIQIDVEFFTEYIRDTIHNTFESEAHEIAVREIEKIVEDEYRSVVKSLTVEAVKQIVDRQVSEFMAGDITVGGGWAEPTRTLPRNEYLAELVQKKLEEALSKNNTIEYAKKAASEEIEKFARRCRDSINAGIKQRFDETMRQTLTDNVVNLLMASDTFAGLASSVERLLPDGK